MEVIGPADSAGNCQYIEDLGAGTFDGNNHNLITYGVYILFFLLSFVLEKWRGIGKTRSLFFAIETRRSLEAGRVIIIEAVDGVCDS